jgi:hypothetical protein
MRVQVELPAPFLRTLDEMNRRFDGLGDVVRDLVAAAWVDGFWRGALTAAVVLVVLYLLFRRKGD